MQTIKMQIYAITRTTREVMVLLARCNRFIASCAYFTPNPEDAITQSDATTTILGEVQMENPFSKGSM